MYAGKEKLAYPRLLNDAIRGLSIALLGLPSEGSESLIRDRFQAEGSSA